MIAGLMLPEVNGKKLSSKDAIISLLSEEQGLTAKQIHSRIKRNKALNVSYQAVHKVLKELEQNKTITRKGRTYSLNIDWIEGIEKFSSSFKENFFGEELSKPKTYVLNSVAEVDEFILVLFSKIFEIEGKKVLYMQWAHYWIPLFLDKNVYRKFKEILLSVPAFGAVIGNSLVDLFCEKFWRDSGAKVKTGVKPYNHSDILVYGNFVIEVFYSKKIREKTDDFFNSVKKVESVDWNAFYEQVFRKKTKIAVFIQRNPEIAEIMKEQIKSYFKGARK
ncbi:hypothetical protein KKG83_01625 [Candidatus Micrarchaeota archaeon]|nr:hypothetical protein [Candidatus Micrarchaeota archaeon]